jgi:thioredoxin reductase (NADPH)
LLNVPGEELAKVSHYYREPYPFAGQKVAVVRAKNSAAKAALDCFRHGAHVTMVVRQPTFSKSIKYWIRPDLENRIREGSIRALFEASVQEIQDGMLLVQAGGTVQAIPNDWVLASTLGLFDDYRVSYRTS